jgi:photosystem II stability/assembly factor-like uncharacterized protein
MSVPASSSRSRNESIGGRRSVQLLTRISVTLAAVMILTIAVVPNAFASSTWDSDWTVQPSGRGNYLTDVDFVSPSTGWAVGGHAILKTTNGGRSWTDQSSNGPIEPQADAAVDFVDSRTGWVVGGNQILKTTDGGSTWTIQTTGADSWLTSLNSVHFVDASTGWVVGWGGGVGSMNGIIYKTTDGGATWIAQTSGTTAQLWSVNFVDANNGWAAGELGHILHTTNGGADWIPQTPNLNQDYRSIQFINASTGWAVGLNGGIIHTTNGGNTWLPQVSGTPSQLRSVCFVDANNGWAVGYAPGGAAPMLSTTDGGATWIAGSWPAQEWLFSIQFIDASTGWAVGWGGTIIHRGALPDLSYNITPSAGPHGTISPNTTQLVSSGGSRTFTIEPSARYYTTDVRVDGTSVGASSSVTFANVTADHQISASFAANRVTVYTPIAPASMSHSKYCTVYGYLKPRHSSGTYPVRIYTWKRSESGLWKPYGYVTASASNYSTFTKYVKAMKLPYKGRWRLRAYAPQDSQHLATWSTGYDYVTVN